MTDRTAVVVTSIAAPNAVLRALAEGCRRNGWDFVVIGDAKSPPDFRLEACRYFDLAAQARLGFALAARAPVGHYARKNLGYLAAIRAGAGVIVETDDDNHPLAAFWQTRERRPEAALVGGGGWINVYRLFADAPIWPRGLPLDAIHAPLASFETWPREPSDCPIQQELADDNPDVDAIWRLVAARPVAFAADRAVALARGAWAPFNSQTTVWWRDAFPLLYLPAGCSFRMTDIWRALVAQRIAWENGWRILFRSPSVRQERNPHDLMRDFADEVPGYLHNRRIAETLEALVLAPGAAAIPANLARCYDALIGLGLLPAGERVLLDAWLADLAAAAS
ncbi:MAG TPA: hypothetical protein VMB81_15735 [Candidatus Sulfotelmatobacter sp.]|nr:hypothetical protein [Candidatus Sulfotelmatobacter sp.]